ncbi:P27 family phage terminase small subunit [Actinomadura violacea]|uniref:P27 family phage terminase small subunit n=1 Tax=Actinomadura violacea TaxID=2819934 RepID=A0ABS3RWZ9_9ACTN|nr:P27 family phage terminase small subunit [Actinomadura violacea]MBO2461166.1 P27 family phage terminase small subunit [Actinomadura violacea]
MPKRGTRQPATEKAPESAALQLLDGGGDTTVPAPVDPPDWLSDEATTLWHTLAPHTAPGTLTEGTAPAFAFLCNALATYVDADQMVQTAGVLIAEGQGLAPNPALAIRERADATVGKWARHFGLIPDPHTAAPATTQRPRTLPHLVEGG